MNNTKTPAHPGSYLTHKYVVKFQGEGRAFFQNKKEAIAFAEGQAKPAIVRECSYRTNWGHANKAFKKLPIYPQMVFRNLVA